MRIAVAVIGALALAVSPALAQNPPEGPGGPGRRMELLLHGITLTAAQQAKVDSIRARYRADMPAITPGARPDSATREQMREHFRRIADEVRAVLTPDQQKVWDQNVAELRARRPGGP
jgi:Spy/CpxP family protein refolding chaperone